MKASLTKRKQLSHSNKPETPPTTSATPHPGYAPDAAFHAIKRHALEFVNPKELQVSNFTPTSRSTTNKIYMRFWVFCFCFVFVINWY